MNIILEANNLCKTFSIDKKNHYQALKNINLQITRGEFVALMGPSGSGKSTLLYNLSGMDQLTTGSVKFDGKELSSLSENQLSKLRLTKMGFIFQQNYLLKNLSIFDNIVFSAYLAKIDDREEIKRRALTLMEKVDIAELFENDITQASGGQLQRAAICRSLINKPDIVFGDEPTGALNSKSANDIMKILTQINESGTTILLATHDIKVAAKTERVIYILDGRIMAEISLGKYNSQQENNLNREKQVSEWLMKLGF